MIHCSGLKLSEQGESVSTALENITKASYVSLVKNVPATVASELRMHSSVFSRLGETSMTVGVDVYLITIIGASCIAWSLDELLLECHFEHFPAEERLHAVSKRACAVR